MIEPMHWSMKIMREAIREIEAENKISLGDHSWSIIKDALAEIDTKWDRMVDEEMNRNSHKVANFDDAFRMIFKELNAMTGLNIGQLPDGEWVLFEDRYTEDWYCQGSFSKIFEKALNLLSGKETL